MPTPNGLPPRRPERPPKPRRHVEAGPAGLWLEDVPIPAAEQKGVPPGTVRMRTAIHDDFIRQVSILR